MPEHLLAIAVGNTRTRVGLFRDGELLQGSAVASADTAAVAAAVRAAGADAPGVPLVMASVNPPADREIERLVADGRELLRIGRDVPVPLEVAVAEGTAVGQDRLLCAFAAYRRAAQACVVVDAGTAITVDFVDGEGVFQGGVIAPGLTMMLRALHRHTAQLPELAYAPPDAARGPFGKDTAHAMLLGVRAAARGLVRETVEQFAEAYEAYPQIVATGGDAAALFDGDDLVEQIVPDLQLIGILEACRALDEEPEP